MQFVLSITLGRIHPVSISIFEGQSGIKVTQPIAENKQRDGREPEVWALEERTEGRSIPFDSEAEGSTLGIIDVHCHPVRKIGRGVLMKSYGLKSW